MNNFRADQSFNESDNPLITLIVVNYNIATNKNIILSGLKAILSLDYRPLEIIIVDNGSTDDSYKIINQLLRSMSVEDIRVKLLRLSRNYGFARANILAYKFRSKESQYIGLINNDLVPELHSLAILADFLKRHPDVAGIQGKILDWKGEYIDSADLYLTEQWTPTSLGRGLKASSRNSPRVVTYVDGAYSLYRVEAIEHVGGLFLPWFFMWGDDYELGIRLWRSGYKLVYLPIIVGRHYRSATIRGNLGQSYSYWRVYSNLAVMLIYDDFWLVNFLFKSLVLIVRAILEHDKYLIAGCMHALKVGLKLRRKMCKFRYTKLREPKLKVDMLRLALFIARMFIRHGVKKTLTHIPGIYQKFLLWTERK